MTLHNSLMGVFLGILVCLLPLSSWAQSTPVYLKPNNSAATGHYDKDLLKHRAIRYESFEWLWVRTPEGQNGWILKSSAMLPLDFSRQAVLAQGEPIHHQPKSFQLPQKTLSQSQIVTLVERKKDWFKIIYKENSKKFFGWVHSRYLSPYSKDAGFLFSTKETHLRKRPQMKSKVLRTIQPGHSMVPLKVQSGWALVQYQGIKGYVPFRHMRSRMDVAIKVRTDKGYFKPNPQLFAQKIKEIFANPIWVGTGPFTLDLKEKPEMGSKTLVRVSPWQSLILQGYSIKKWGLSHVPQLGQVWWPETTIESNVEIIENLSPQMVRLRSSEIYQIEKSPIVPGLRFASATHGIYRSFDGKSWHPIQKFRAGYPIKMAENGVLFVADQVSYDHGESFQGFVRWDRIFDSLPNKEKISSGSIQIMNVEPHQKNHRQVTLSLRVGSRQYIQMYTPDLGKNWRLR